MPDLATQLRLLAYPLTDIYDLSDADSKTLIAAASELDRLRNLIVEWYDAHQNADDVARNIDAAIALVQEARGA